ncbi:NAD+ synthase [Miltoncostaea oceani]|uniref:NAD+ synthase n=1 Tax=Miltoncostaea oceani TaxID=2843216 RepID=UPI001FEB3406|nr:NAD+ synthase [Miltoncostaea oceani]
MTDPTVRIALAQLNQTAGDLEGNAARISVAAARAADLGADILLTPELSLTGYPVEDLVLRGAFLEQTERALEAQLSSLPLPTLIGAPLMVGRDLFNCAVLGGPGVPRLSYAKRALPNYAVFDEARWFTPGAGPCIIEIGGMITAISICEDIWHADSPTAADQVAGADLILNISASPYERGKPRQREQMLLTRARDGMGFVAYCNAVGGMDDLVFDGGALVVGPGGEVIARAGSFSEDLICVDLDPGELTRLRRRAPRPRAVAGQTANDVRAAVVPVLAAPAPTRAEAQDTGELPGRSPERIRRDDVAGAGAEDTAQARRLTARRFLARLEPAIAAEPCDDLESVWGALRLGLGDFVDKNGFTGVVLGLSGGIDSALVAALAVEALGPERVLCVSMPSRFNSASTQTDAAQIAANLGCGFREIGIESLRNLVGSILPDTAGVAAENVQARLRGLLLMAISNQEGPLVLACSNKSETAVGYATLYGDTAGGYAPLRDVPKTLVFALSRLVNERAGAQVIPVRVIDRPPSAELADDQRDSDSLPDYPVLDAILDAYVERDLGVDQIVRTGIAPRPVIERVARLVDGAEHKRRQAPLGTRITPKAFGRDRRLPITNRFRETGPACP